MAALAAFLFGRVRARATLALVDALGSLGLYGAARAVCRRALRRCERRRRVLAMAGRRG